MARTLTLSVSPSASQTAKDFAEFLTREHCKETIARHNLLPPLHAPDPSQFAKAALPRRNDPQIQLASANAPLPLVLDDPDAAQAKPPAKIETLVAKAEPEVSASADTPTPPEDEAAAPRAYAGESEAASEPASRRGRSAVPVRQSSGLDLWGAAARSFWPSGRAGWRVETEEEAA